MVGGSQRDPQQGCLDRYIHRGPQKAGKVLLKAQNYQQGEGSDVFSVKIRHGYSLSLLLTNFVLFR